MFSEDQRFFGLWLIFLEDQRFWILAHVFRRPRIFGSWLMFFRGPRFFGLWLMFSEDKSFWILAHVFRGPRISRSWLMPMYVAFHTSTCKINIFQLGCVCFGWKWFQEIIFPQTRMFGSNEKWNFSEIHFLLTEIYAFDPEMILHSHFHFKSFPGHAKHRESERKNAERARERTTYREREKEQYRESERKNAERARERTTQREREPERTLWPSQWVKERTKAPIQQTSERKNQSSDPATDIDQPHASHAELSQTITAPNAADPWWVRA